MSFLRRLFSKRQKILTVPHDPEEPWQSEAHGELVSIGRSVVVVRPREPFVRWVRQVEPVYYSKYTLAEARFDGAWAFLAPPPYGGGGARECQEFVDEHWHHFFAQMLEGFELDRKRWPQQRSLAMFKQWCDVELCQGAIDLGDYAE